MATIKRLPNHRRGEAQIQLPRLLPLSPLPHSFALELAQSPYFPSDEVSA